MLRRDHGLVLVAIVLAACQPRSDLGGQAQRDACARDCDVVDAGQASLDAGPTRPGSRLDSGSPEEVVAFVTGLAGVWYGFAENPNPIVDQENPPSLFEVTFVAGDNPGQGSFSVRCLEKTECDPFGPGSARPTGGAFRIVNLDPRAGARGELAWPSERNPDFSVSAPFSRMQRNEAGGPALTFVVGSLFGGPQAPIARTVTLGFGPQPTDAGATPTSDAGASDAGAP